MIHYKTKEEVAFIKESCQIVSETLEYVAYFLKPGISTKEIDDKAESLFYQRVVYLLSRVIMVFLHHFVFR